MEGDFVRPFRGINQNCRDLLLHFQNTGLSSGEAVATCLFTIASLAVQRKDKSPQEIFIEVCYHFQQVYQQFCAVMTLPGIEDELKQRVHKLADEFSTLNQH